jgi:hypothetical protein
LTTDTKDARVHYAVLKLRAGPAPTTGAYPRTPTTTTDKQQQHPGHDERFDRRNGPTETTRDNTHPTRRPFPQDPTACQTSPTPRPRVPTHHRAAGVLTRPENKTSHQSMFHP